MVDVPAHYRAHSVRYLVVVLGRRLADQQSDQSFAMLDIFFGRVELERVEAGRMAPLKRTVIAAERTNTDFHTAVLVETDRTQARVFQGEGQKRCLKDGFARPGRAADERVPREGFALRIAMGRRNVEIEVERLTRRRLEQCHGLTPRVAVPLAEFEIMQR